MFLPKLHKYNDEAQSRYSPVTKEDIGFSLISRMKGEYRSVNPVFTCRDYINDTMIYDRNGKVFSYHDAKIPLSWNRTKLAFFTSKLIPLEEAAIKLSAARRIINFYEEIGRFSRKSKLIQADYDGKANAWLFLGPKEWMKSSHLISMITLITRLVYRTSKSLPGKISDISQIHNFFASVIKEPYCYDSRYMENFQMFEMLMAKYSKIFNLSEKDLFPEEKVEYWHSDGGIASLCAFSSGNDKLNNNVKREWELWKREHKILDVNHHRGRSF